MWKECMTSDTWTVFRRCGHTAGYEPRWEVLACTGIRAVSGTAAREPDGTGKNCLVLYLRRKNVRICNERGQSISFEESGIQPGDLITAGTVQSPGAVGGWQIREVTPLGGMLGGWKITAR